MEIHPTLAIKSPGLGDPEAGWVTHLNHYRRRNERRGKVGVEQLDHQSFQG